MMGTTCAHLAVSMVRKVLTGTSKKSHEHANVQEKQISLEQVQHPMPHDALLQVLHLVTCTRPTIYNHRRKGGRGQRSGWPSASRILKCLSGGACGAHQASGLQAFSTARLHSTLANSCGLKRCQWRSKYSDAAWSRLFGGRWYSFAKPHIALLMSCSPHPAGSARSLLLRVRCSGCAVNMYACQALH